MYAADCVCQTACQRLACCTQKTELPNQHVSDAVLHTKQHLCLYVCCVALHQPIKFQHAPTHLHLSLDSKRPSAQNVRLCYKMHMQANSVATYLRRPNSTQEKDGPSKNMKYMQASACLVTAWQSACRPLAGARGLEAPVHPANRHCWQLCGPPQYIPSDRGPASACAELLGRDLSLNRSQHNTIAQGTWHSHMYILACIM